MNFFSNIFESSNPKKILFSQHAKKEHNERMAYIHYQEILRIRDKTKKFIPKPLRKFFWG
ncbi:hypothetical protein CQA66_06280 [Helicobacter aurati]|uniref:Uncharacterized protein n=1 Tax=Helicobacter aurati TaxID=137778 RepID=A0A3D8J2D7_9HELI|nr:hypothetical protein [Helicobacter aurati]RDU71563.1 hypothetical protein CQA66_06280 [Helicobacter aurati]